MSKEPNVPPYVIKSPPEFGATYQGQPDTRFTDEYERVRANGQQSSNGNGQSANGSVHRSAAPMRPPPADPSTRKPGFLDQFWSRFRPLTPADDAAGETADADEGPAGVVYAITKKTDFWFDREVFTIERDARKEAADWATQGLPRHDLERVDPLEIELVLAGRCVELFRQWVGRVRTRMRDAINAEAEGIGRDVSSLESAIDRLGELRDSARRADEEIGYLSKKENDERPPIGFEPIVSNRLFFPLLAVLLTAVEFFANFPLFRLLLPLHTSLASAAKEAVLDVGDQWYAGLALWWKMSIWHVEAFVVAFAVVVVLVVFGKAVGQSARLLTALRQRDFPLAGGSISSARRQAWAVVLACILGSSLVISALYRARSQVVAVAQERVATTSSHLDSLRAEANAPETRSNIAKMSMLTQSILEQQRTLEVHRDDYGYAETVYRNNTAILLLNIGLVLAAGLVGFLSAKYRLTHQFGADPRIAALRERRAQVDRDVREQLATGYASLTGANAGIGRVEHLIRSSPLEQWPAKAKRLSGIIPMFRADNARLRGLDSASILAFRQPPPLDLPTFEAERGFDEPADFSALKARFQDARAQFTRLAGANQ